MPIVAVFFGVMIRLNYNDHPPPHVHAVYGGHEALIEIETGRLLAGTLPARISGVVREWVLENRAELMQNWDRARRHEPINRIAGADE